MLPRANLGASDLAESERDALLAGRSDGTANTLRALANATERIVRLERLILNTDGQRDGGKEILVRFEI